MRRNCNLELQLLPASSAYLASSDTDSDQRRSEKQLVSESPDTPNNNQPLTIFYNGKICVCDVTDFQARAILLLASREMEERVRTPTAGLGLGSPAGLGLVSPACSPSVQFSPACTPTSTPLSMKRSLQRFLQKRKYRAQAMTPYHR